MSVHGCGQAPPPQSHAPRSLSTAVRRSPSPSPTKATTPRRSSKPGTAGSKERSPVSANGWCAVGVEGLDGFQPPCLAFGPFGLGPGDGFPVRGEDQPRDRVAQLYPVAAGFVDVEKECLLNGVLVRAGFD